jgi:hypothetical protein
MKVYLHYYNSTHRGPGMVVTNLLLGLQQLGIEITTKPSQADYIGCLQTPQGHDGIWLRPNTLMGPNLFVIPSEAPWISDKFTNFVVPSVWVKDLYTSFSSMSDKTIEVWPVGIDTDKWNSNNKSSSTKQRCFIYYKNRKETELELVKSSLIKLGIEFEIISYGNYKEEELFELCNKSDFAILLTDTESQGIAYMNILSTNTPCLVFNKDKWVYGNNSSIQCNATSVPYFSVGSGACGEVFLLNNDLNKCSEDISAFDYIKYNPRNYILSEHTLDKSAKNYISLLQKQ